LRPPKTARYNDLQRFNVTAGRRGERSVALPRWREFEKEVAALFERAGFRVEMNPKAAKPRQTDLYAHDDKFHILVEAKNQSRKIDVSVIDALRARLNRLRADVIGAIFTTSSLTRTAIQEIEADRTREILVFAKDELDQLRKGRSNLRALIERKRQALAIQGKVWFSTGSDAEFLRVALPVSDIEFRVGGATRSYFESRSDFSGASYALHLPDTGWGTAAGEGARLSIQLALSNIRDLRDLLGYIQENFGLSKNGTFFIHQSETCWHGAGAQNFVDTVRGWRERYARSLSKSFHHSEDFSYFDALEDGWIQVSAQQRVGRDETAAVEVLHNSELVIQLPGLPVDTSRFLKLCQYAGNEGARFVYISERWTAMRRLKKSIKLDIVGTVLKRDADEKIVVGVIARNPFFRKASLPKELRDPEIPPLSQLRETELLLCNLSDWHDDGDEIDYYKLHGIEVTEGGAGPIVRPFGTWNGLLKRRKELSDRGLLSMEKRASSANPVTQRHRPDRGAESHARPPKGSPDQAGRAEKLAQVTRRCGDRLPFSRA
jgi:hypothetical protein